MDPDVTLKEIKDLAKQCEDLLNLEDPPSLADVMITASELGEKVIALDRWVTCEGKLPAKWENKEKHQKILRKIEDILWPEGISDTNWGADELQEIGNLMESYGYGPEELI
jgi:hypothetical protein